jgi:hypothetical protein
MQKIRPLGAAVAGLALLFVVLSGPAVADTNWGRNGRRSGGGGQTATFNVGSLPSDFQSRILDRLGREPGLQAAGIAVDFAGGIIRLVGQITTEVLNLVKSILAQLGVSFPINVLPGGGGATTTTTTTAAGSPGPTTTTTVAPGGGGGGGALPGFQETLLALIRQFVDRVLALIRDFLPV